MLLDVGSCNRENQNGQNNSFESCNSSSQVQYVLNNPKFTTPVYCKSIFLFQMIIYAMKRKSAAITRPTAVEPTMTLEAPLPPPAEEEDDGERVTDGFTPAPGDAAEMTSLALAEPEAVAEAALPETT